MCEGGGLTRAYACVYVCASEYEYVECTHVCLLNSLCGRLHAHAWGFSNVCGAWGGRGAMLLGMFLLNNSSRLKHSRICPT